MKNHFESYFLDVITSKRKGIFASLLRLLLLLLSWPFKLIVTCRNWIYDHGWVCRYSPPVPVVISIGNIVVGGTGKTPVTLMLAQEFYSEYPMAILSRGYRSQAEKLAVPIILSKGEGPMQSAAFCGDEPYLIAQNLPKAFVIVGKNRHKASDIAARAGVQVILLDDGMQHRRLARDYEVVVMDMLDPFGQGYFLPRGLLREGVSSLSRADLIILNHVSNPEAFQSLKQKLAEYSNAPVIGTCMELVQVENLSGDPISSLKDKKVGVFCGIANPEYFQNTVLKYGGQIMDSTFVPDHLSLEPAALAAFAEQCKVKGAELLLCTEKDKVKLINLPDLAIPLGWVKMRLKVVEGHQEWLKFTAKVKSGLTR